VIVIEPSFLNSFVALAAARIAGAKAWLHVQDLEIDLAFDLGQLRHGRRIAEAIERWVMRRFDGVSTISDGLVERLRAKGVPKPLLLPNWFDPNELVPGPSRLRRQLAMRESETVVMFAGTLGAKQGIESIIHAARLLETEMQLSFVIAGEGPSKAELERLAHGLRNVRFLPLQPPEGLNDLLNCADIHVLPQQPAAAGLVLPSKLIGMLASGRPVVACTKRDSEIARLVSGCGLIVEPGDAQALARALLTLANHKVERLRLGQSARRVALANFSKEEILPRWDATLRGLSNPLSAASTVTLRTR
jgi:colanic acid biosynthesis glycosyl transferase WcaI